MKSIDPYLNFDGRTREAMTFYHGVLGGTLNIQSFADAGMAQDPAMASRTIHASLTHGTATLMASDTMPGMPFVPGNNIHVSVQCESAEEIERHFAGMSVGGIVRMELQDTFWGARFGMLTDRYGVHWMFNFDKGQG